MEDKKFLQNVKKIIEMVLKNAGGMFGVDFMVINNTAIEVDKRLKEIK